MKRSKWNKVKDCSYSDNRRTTANLHCPLNIRHLPGFKYVSIEIPKALLPTVVINLFVNMFKEIIKGGKGYYRKSSTVFFTLRQWFYSRYGQAKECVSWTLVTNKVGNYWEFVELLIYKDLEGRSSCSFTSRTLVHEVS